MNLKKESSKMESKKLVFYMSDGHEEFVGVVDWSQDTAQHIHDLMEHCRTFRTNLDVVEIVAFAMSMSIPSLL